MSRRLSLLRLPRLCFSKSLIPSSEFIRVLSNEGLLVKSRAKAETEIKNAILTTFAAFPLGHFVWWVLHFPLIVLGSGYFSNYMNIRSFHKYFINEVYLDQEGERVMLVLGNGTIITTKKGNLEISFSKSELEKLGPESPSEDKQAFILIKRNQDCEIVGKKFSKFATKLEVLFAEGEGCEVDYGLLEKTFPPRAEVGAPVEPEE